MPSTAIYSKGDGVITWELCREDDSLPHAENVEVHGSHAGMFMNPMALAIVAERLSQPAGQWSKIEEVTRRRLVHESASAHLHWWWRPFARLH